MAGFVSVTDLTPVRVFRHSARGTFPIVDLDIA